MTPATALLLALLSAAPTRIAVVPLEAGEGVSGPTAQGLTEAVVAELRKRGGLEVMTPQEVQSLLALERQKQLMGCQDATCASQASQVLGVERLLVGSVSRLGQSWLVNLKLLEARAAGQAVQSSRRLKDRSVDDVLDVLPGMVAELLGTTVPPPAVASTATAGAPDAGGAAAQAGAAGGGSSGARDEPWGPAPRDVRVLSDGAGHYVVVGKKFDGFDTPFFAGDAQGLWAQRVGGGGAEGDVKFSLTFWDPRHPDGWMRDFSFDHGKYALQCGQKKVEYKPVPAKEAKAVLAKAKLYKPRWRRALHAVARDDLGTYYVVDAPRDAADAPTDGSPDKRLFVGRKGAFREVALEDALDDAGGLLLLTREGGRLRFGDGGKKAEWLLGGATSALTPVDPFSVAALLYGPQGPYRTEALRTACDPHR